MLVFAVRRHDDVAGRDRCGPFTRANKHKHPPVLCWLLQIANVMTLTGLSVWQHVTTLSRYVYQGTETVVKHTQTSQVRKEREGNGLPVWQ